MREKDKTGEGGQPASQREREAARNTRQDKEIIKGKKEGGREGERGDDDRQPASLKPAAAGEPRKKERKKGPRSRAVQKTKNNKTPTSFIRGKWRWL